MPVKQHVQETGGREENEGGVCLGHSGCVVLEQGSWDVDQKSLLRLVTPGNGRVLPFCSLSRWDPDRSTRPVGHRTWGRESPEEERQRRSCICLDKTESRQLLQFSSHHTERKKFG